MEDLESSLPDINTTSGLFVDWKENAGVAIGISILFIFGTIGTILRYIALPAPDFSILKTIFDKGFPSHLKIQQEEETSTEEEQQDDNQKEKEEAENDTCFICLQTYPRPSSTCSSSSSSSSSSNWCFFLPCFHSCCKNCAIHLFKHDEGVKAVQRNQDPEERQLYNAWHEGVPEGDKSHGSNMKCPMCRVPLLAFAPKELFLSNDHANDNVNNKNDDFLKKLEQDFPAPLRDANHRFYHENSWTSNLLGLQQQQQIDSTLYKTGKHLGFHRNNNNRFRIVGFDYRKFGEVLIAVGFILSQLFIVCWSFCFPQKGQGNDDEGDELSFDDF